MISIFMLHECVKLSQKWTAPFSGSISQTYEALSGCYKYIAIHSYKKCVFSSCKEFYIDL